MDIRQVANLAKIELKDEEIPRYQKEIDQILGYVDRIAGLDLDGIEPTSYAAQLFDVVRPDEARDGGLSLEDVLANAPAVAQDQFRLPKVVE